MNICRKVSLVLTFAFFVLACSFALAQTPVSDTIIKTTKSNSVDSVIEVRASKYKATYWLYDQLYKSDPNDAVQVAQVKKEKPDPLLRYSGKTIRNVIIKSLDPFGTYIDDTLMYSPDEVGMWANRMVIATTDPTIKNLLLFREGDVLDPFKLRESERLLRKQEYVRDARVYVASTSPRTAEEVDVVVVVQNRWSISIGAGFSTTEGDFNLTESNFIGTGSKISQRGRFNFQELQFTDWSGEFKKVNINRSYVDATVFYNVSPGTRSYGLNFDRGFYSPLTKWAGSAGSVYFDNDLEYNINNEFFVPAKLGFVSSDFWLGRSLALNKRTIDGKNSSIVLGARYTRTDYVERPPLSLDSLYEFKDQKLFLFSLGISSRRYYKDTKIFRFGNVEDVPEGRAFNIIMGRYFEGQNNFIYNALRLSAGRRFPGIGYFEAGAEYGIYYNDYKPSRGVFNFDSYYFTELLTYGRYGLRQFVAFNLTNGLNRQTGDRISINGRGQDGLFGFNSNIAYGENKTLLKFQTLVYTPFHWAGIQLTAFTFAGFGKIGRPFYSELNPNTIYQAYGLGVQARKENLAINTIQISFGFYPNIPTGTGPGFRYNPISVGRGSFKDFDVSKPELVDYR